MKHFEDIWVEAERISSEVFPEESTRQMSNNIRLEAEQMLAFVDNDQCDMLPESIGEILFYLTRICKQHNINSWKELEEAVNNAKIDLYDED